MHLPVSDTAVYAGLTRDQRAAERRLRRKAEALAQRSAPGQYNAAKTHCGTCGLAVLRGQPGHGPRQVRHAARLPGVPNRAQADRQPPARQARRQAAA